MDGTKPPNPPSELCARFGSEASPLVIDVRRDRTFAGTDRLIPSTFHQSLRRVESLARASPANRPVTVYCVHAHEVSQSVATLLRAFADHFRAPR